MIFFEEDIKGIISDPNISWEKLRERRILVTGATGLIGKIVVHVLGELNKTDNFGIKVYAMGRNTEKGHALEQISGVKFISVDIRERTALPSADYIIHCAAVTESARMVAEPIEVIDIELQGGKNILEFARVNNVHGIVYTSSMEVYGTLDVPEVHEEDLGYMDLKSPRSSYPQSKRMMETICNCYYSQYSVPVNIVRLGMCFGAGADFMNDKRVWAQFARYAKKGSPIILHTTGESLSSVVYTADAIRGIFLVLLGEKRGETYNIASVRLTIREIAERVAKKFALKVIIVPVETGKYARDFKLPLNSDRIKSLGWKPAVTQIEDMFERMIKEI